MLALSFLVPLGLGCHSESPEAKAKDPVQTGDDTGTPWVTPGCGDGVVQDGEACDEGSGNSDTLPDACRTNCSEASCGDGVQDVAEACDDANEWGGDGCTPACVLESGQAEVEPNDVPDEASVLADSQVVGSLPEGDVRDCLSFALDACGGVAAAQLEPCDDQVRFELYDPTSALVAMGTPGPEGCSVLDPAEATGARQAQAGPWTLCISGFDDREVPAYAASIEPLDFEAVGQISPVASDLDLDGQSNTCDLDRDGDGHDNDDDNCPDTPNGGGPGPSPSSGGFIRSWLAAGPFTGTKSTDECRPSDDDLVASPDSSAVPHLGDLAGATDWTILWSSTDRIEFLTDYGGVAAPREVYTAVYVYSATTRVLTLAVGPDDGIRAWWDGAEVLDVATCQGTVVDQFQTPVTLDTGWHLLMLKIRDGGGGWGNYARFLDGTAPVTDLELSFEPGPWTDDQGDLDKDGVGDACDPTPVGG